MRDATTPPPPSAPLRTPPTPRYGAGYHSYEPYSVPRRSQRVSLLHKNNDKDLSTNSQSSSSSPKSSLQRTASTQTLSPPSSPAVHQQTPARPTPARQSLFTRNRPVNNTNSNPLLDVFPTQSSIPTPVSMLPTPHKTPRKLDTATLQSTARILNFKPTTAKPAMSAPRKKAKGRLTLDDQDVHDEVNIFTDLQDRVPTVDNTKDNPFVGPRQTRSRARAQTAPSSKTDVDMDGAPSSKTHVDMDGAHSQEKGMYYVFRGKKIWRSFHSDGDGDEPGDSDASTGSNSSLKRKAGATATRPLSRTNYQPRLLFPTAVSDNDADEEAMTDIDDESDPTPAPALFSAHVQTKKTPSKRIGAHPATPPSSHRQLRSAAEHVSVFEGPHRELNHALASPSATPMPNKMDSPPLFAGWSRAKDADEKTPRGEKRHHMPEPDVPAKRTRSNLFSGRH